MKNSPYAKSSNTAEPRLGVVKLYNPLTKTYVVEVSGVGEKTDVRALVSGVSKPYPPKTRVIVCRPALLDWIIFGEVEMSSSASGTQQDVTNSNSADEVFASQEGNLLRQLFGRIVNSKSFRPVDPENQYEDPEFVGDAVLQNRTTRHSARSKVSVNATGDILARASKLCFLFMSRAKNAIIQTSRDWFLTVFGYEISVQTNVDKLSLNYGKSQTKTIVKADPTKKEFTRLQYEGLLNLTDSHGDSGLLAVPVAGQGTRAVYGKLIVKEIDTQTGTIRLQVGENENRVAIVVGNTVAESSVHPVSGRHNNAITAPITFTAGMVIQTDKGLIEITPNKLKVTVGDSVIDLTEEAVSLTGKTIKFNAVGNLEINATGDIAIKSSSNLQLSGTTINAITS